MQYNPKSPLSSYMDNFDTKLFDAEAHLERVGIFWELLDMQIPPTQFE